MQAKESPAPYLLPEPAKLMIAGGVSGVLAKTATAPLGRLTILYQVEDGSVLPPDGACIRHAGRMHDL